MDNGEKLAFKCERCGIELGKMEPVGAGELLRIGKTLVRYAHGFCGECGKEFHWSISDRMLERIIERAKR